MGNYSAIKKKISLENSHKNGSTWKSNSEGGTPNLKDKSCMLSLICGF